MLVARENWGTRIPKKELSVFPALETTWFHEYDEYARLLLLPPDR